MPSVGTHFTVATVQTLARRDMADLAQHFGCVVVDEAHRTPTNTHTQTVQAFPARYRLGLTATPDRADGLGAAMLAVLGPVAAHLTTAQLARAGRVVVPAVRFVATRFRYRYQEDYGALLAALCADAGRNALIARTVAAEARRGHTCLVLSERVEHCHLMSSALATIAPDVPAAVLTGEATARQRAATLGAMRDGRLRALFATKLADEGLDLPALDRVLLTTGGRAAGRLAQQVGRAMRAAAGKRGAKVIDFTDPQVGVLAAQARARQRDVYAPLGARIEGDRPA
jgi:superfamily II DNA or RNA helicase